MTDDPEALRAQLAETKRKLRDVLQEAIHVLERAQRLEAACARKDELLAKHMRNLLTYQDCANERGRR